MNRRNSRLLVWVLAEILLVALVAVIFWPRDRTLDGLYEAKPLSLSAKSFPPAACRHFNGMIECLQFVTGAYVHNYVYHRVLISSRRGYSCSVYYYICRGNKLWIYMGSQEEPTLLEEGTISPDGQRIHLVSKDPGARIGFFPLDRVLTRSSRKLKDPIGIRDLGLQLP